MAEYIEREALRLAIFNTCWRSFADVDTAYDMADRIPAADVAPVRHGRWVKTEEPLGWHEVDCVECSVCHDSWVGHEEYGFDFLKYWKYCPNCGAKMDLEEENT